MTIRPRSRFTTGYGHKTNVIYYDEDIDELTNLEMAETIGADQINQTLNNEVKRYIESWKCGEKILLGKIKSVS